jgi:hypothetical protein
MNESSFSFRHLNLEQGSLELTEEYIQQRAYQIWEQRGRQHGHDVEDWLQAETEIFGKKTAEPAEPEKKEVRAAQAIAA